MQRLDLKVLRVKKNLTQAELAKKLGVSISAYSLLEQGKRKGSTKTWLAIQKEFELTGEQAWNLQHNI